MGQYAIKSITNDTDRFQLIATSLRKFVIDGVDKLTYYLSQSWNQQQTADWSRHTASQ